MLVGLLALAAVPAGILLSRQTDRVSLLDAWPAVPVAGVLGFVAFALGRKAQLRTARTLGRVGGERLARVGVALGVAALLVATAAALSLAFYGLLTVFAD